MFITLQHYMFVPYCDITMFDRLQHYYVWYIATLGKVWHIAMLGNVCFSHYDEGFLFLRLWCWNRFVTVRKQIMFVTPWRREMFLSFQYCFMFVTLAHWVAYITLWRCVVFLPLEHLEMLIIMWRHDVCTTFQCGDIFVTLRWYTYVCYIAMSIYVCQIVIKILCSSNYDRKCSLDFNVPICLSHCNVTVFGRLQRHYDRHIATFGNFCQIVTFIYVRHIAIPIYVCDIANLLCLIDCNVTMFDILRYLQMFVTLWRQDMSVTVQRDEMFVILQLEKYSI
jgi:hypothetical protein